jgi:uncharacterized protein YbaA (DUF1428 family)
MCVWPGSHGFAIMTLTWTMITQEWRVQRDRVLMKVMSDPRLAKVMDPAAMPFDHKRRANGGLKTLVAC